jgi:hypothetical protein
VLVKTHIPNRSKLTIVTTRFPSRHSACSGPVRREMDPSTPAARVDNRRRIIANSFVDGIVT